MAAETLRLPRRQWVIGARWLALLALAFAAGSAGAQSLESALSPGPLIEGHAKVEGQCEKCHVRFDRAAQDRLCMDCHKEVGQDVRQHTGFHGRQKPQACRACHTEHKGRDVRIAQFDRKTFDHAQTDFALRGGHARVECDKCHESGKKFRAAPQECVACHRKDDKHKGSLGPKCADCHTETGWKQTRFDHTKTRFALTGKHIDARCESCHKAENFKDTPMACVACHRKDDKQHKGRFGEKCETCHGTQDWKKTTFNHDTDTKYALAGKHRAARCESCHTGPLYQDHLSTACNDCHAKDDKHKGTLGTNCAACHNERGWKEKGRFDHGKTKFPLLGKHLDTECKSCHLSTLFKEAPTQCIGCHRKDDKHERTLGEACGDCHTERDWKTTRFDHARTRFPLHGAHGAARVKCADCHRDARSFRNTATDCFACHRKDDKHEGQQGKDCAQCHVDSEWKSVAKFDHGLTRFPLLGKHAPLDCAKCHVGKRFKDAQRQCSACHLKDDHHKKTLGTACEQCHNVRSWKAWTFDHDRQTKFALDGKHKGAACSACHSRPAEGRVTASSACYACHAKDDVHESSFGRQCEQCHVTESFRKIRSRVGRPAGNSDLRWPLIPAARGVALAARGFVHPAPEAIQ